MKFTPLILVLSFLMLFSCKPDPKTGSGNKAKATNTRGKSNAGRKEPAKLLQPKKTAAAKGNKANAKNPAAKKTNAEYPRCRVSS